MQNIRSILFLSIFLLPISAQQLPDSLLSHLDRLSPREKVTYLTDLCWNLREKQTENALKYGMKAIKLADSINYTSEYARANNDVGVILIHYKYNTKEAVPYFHTSLEAGLRLKDSIAIGYSYNNLGDAYYLTGNTPLALNYAEKSMEYFKGLNDSAGIAYSHINFGLLYRYEKDYEKALEHFFKAIDIRKKLNNELGIASALYEVALVYYKMEEYEKALEYFTEAYKRNSAINNKRWTAFSLNGIGNVLYQYGKYDEALENFNKSYQLNKDRNHIYGMIDNKIGKALVYSKINREQEGIEELNRAIVLAEKIDVTPKLLDTYEAFVKFYLNTGNYKNAMDRFDNLLFVYDSLFYKSAIRNIA